MRAAGAVGAPVEDDAAFGADEVREARRLAARSSLGRILRAEAALERRPEPFPPALRVGDPFAYLERRVVAHVASMAAVELGDPVAAVVLVVPDDGALHPARVREFPAYPRRVDELRRELLNRFRWVDGHADVWRWFDDGALFARLGSALADPFREAGVTKVAGIEARGFVLGAIVAVELRAGFVALRKDGGLFPGETASRRTPPDYRGVRTSLRLQCASVSPDDCVLLVDDWFETGGQALTAKHLITDAGGELVGAAVLVDQLPAGVGTRLGRYVALVPYSALRPGPDERADDGDHRPADRDRQQ